MIGKRLGRPASARPDRIAGRTHSDATVPPQFHSEPLGRDISAAVLAAGSFEDLLQQLSRIVVRNSSCLGLWFSDSDTDSTRQPQAVIDQDEDVLGQFQASSIEQLSGVACERHELVYQPSSIDPTVQLVSVPVVFTEEAQGALTGCFSMREQAPLRHHWLMTLVGQAILNWSRSRSLMQSQIKMNSMNDTVQLVKSLDSTETIGASGRVIVNHMRRLAETEQVAFVHVDQEFKQGRLIAVSDVEQIDETSPVNQAILGVCQLAISTKTPVVFPVGDLEECPSELEHYCRTSRLNACIGLPLMSVDGETIGALLVAGEPERLCQPKLVEYLQLVSNLVAGHLGMVLKANQGIIQRIRSSAWSYLKKDWARKAAMVVGAAMLAMLIPLPYNVGCECQLEPVVRRFVAAPYDGILEQTFAETGEVVQADQLLARMDGRALRIELAGLQAELDAAKKRRDSALATGDIAQSHIARSEMKRHQAKIELLNRRLENLEVKSPIAGIIVSGDLEKVEGAPLETGQTLFEVGPLDQMVAEILIPESEIRFVKPGQRVKIKLNAYPFRTFYGELTHIHTRSEIVSDKNVFVAEVVMENEDGRLKPGMAGSAKIGSGYYPVGWNLFHNAWEKVRYWMVW